MPALHHRLLQFLLEQTVSSVRRRRNLLPQQTDVATEQVVEEGSVSKTGTIVIPSLKTRTAKEWFEFAFGDRVYGKTSTTAGVEWLFSISGFILSSKRLSMTDGSFNNQIQHWHTKLKARVHCFINYHPNNRLRQNMFNIITEPRQHHFNTFSPGSECASNCEQFYLRPLVFNCTYQLTAIARNATLQISF